MSLTNNPEDRIAQTIYGAVISHWEPDRVGAYLRWGDRILPGSSLQKSVRAKANWMSRLRRRQVREVATQESR